MFKQSCFAFRISVINLEDKEEMAELIGAEVYLLIGERAIFKD